VAQSGEAGGAGKEKKREDREIKAPPSVGAQVVGIAAFFATPWMMLSQRSL
jgi:hypothetical protein